VVLTKLPATKADIHQ